MKNRAESFGSRLSFRRHALKMSQRALGTASGVGHATIQALERGSGLPTIKTVEALATALHISPGWLGFREGNSQAVTLDVAADFDPVAILSQVQEAISRNKPIEQSAKYLDQRGVRYWLEVVRNQAAFVEKMPLLQIAQEIALASRGLPVDVVGLGCGTAEHEIALARLLNGLSVPTRLALIDISVYLLIAGYQQARQTLREYAIDISALVGDIYHFPKHSESLLGSPVKHRRVFCLFGYTFGNLRQEEDLFQRALAEPASRPGDLLLLDITLARPNPETEPSLNNERSAEFRALMEGFVSSPIHSIIGTANSVVVEPRLEPGKLPGSYVINLYGRYQIGHETRFQSLAVVMRYDAGSLSRYLEQQGWRVLNQYSYDGSAAAILMCQKV